MAVESLRVLRRRVRSVKNIRQITRAMEMVSAAKLRRAQGTLGAARPYSAKLQELLARVAGSSIVQNHPLFQPRPGKRRVLVLMTADRGLAGSFNVNLTRRAEQLMREEPDAHWRLVTVGRRGRDHFARRGRPIDRELIGLRGQADSAEAHALAQYLADLFLTGEVDSIHLLYAQFISSVLNRPTVAQFLPLTPAALGLELAEGEPPTGGDVDYILDPSAKAVFDELLPRYLASRIYITMAEQATSEHSARMVAMNNATKNCQELETQLTLRLNKARQASITKELLDIVTGAEALRKG